MTTTDTHSLVSFFTFLSSNPALQQLVPLVVVLAFPLLVLFGRNYFRSVPSFVFHMLAVASSTLPWNWSSIYEHGIVWSKSPKKHPIRTRAQQLASRTNDDRTGAYCTLPSKPSKWSIPLQKSRRSPYSIPGSLIFLEHIAL